jgi:hypothetical protein
MRVISHATVAPCPEAKSEEGEQGKYNRCSLQDREPAGAPSPGYQQDDGRGKKKTDRWSIEQNDQRPERILG